MKSIMHAHVYCIQFCIMLVTSISLNGDTTNLQNSSPLHATVFIHGIISIKPYLTIPNVVKFIRDEIAHTHYARTIEIIRKDPFFYLQQPLGPLRLHKINVTENTAQSNSATPLFASLCSQIGLHAHDTTAWNYYSFGWSGLLSPSMRHLEASILYQDLLQEFLPYAQQNRLKLRLICYSHGGNVALKLGEIFAQETDEKNQQLTIDELILVGVPVLTETDYLINSPLFKKIYHFYSFGDRVQRMDCFSLNRMFSNRIFKARPRFTLPSKLHQIQISVKRSANNHPKQLITFDQRKKAAEKKSQLRTVDPGHSELWSFGWISGGYRTNFPFSPLPFAVFLPYLIAQIQEHMPTTNHLRTELYPDYGCMQLYDFIQKKAHFCDFLSPAQIKHYRENAVLSKPSIFTRNEYNNRIQKAKQIARTEWRKEKGIKMPPYKYHV